MRSQRSAPPLPQTRKNQVEMLQQANYKTENETPVNEFNGRLDIAEERPVT